ncbi:apolipoprotein N-acyltransferase [Streptosporangium saharense]|uniref:Apolipoprotein N-acyltransferase n=1 Tax=Streptosporangium saharense TaxID=1706840 RepID=A0A7W7QU63_9ACTN|nr:apolipoprotein N-acyltransferase [Streptosporangium saharense]MBB4919624.1 apolipoprotein N-acyltransferase [Streptosporangium saharense]
MVQEKTAGPAPGAPPEAAPVAAPTARGRLASRAVGAVAGGVLLYLAFPPIGLWFLAPFGVALLTLAVRDVRARRALWLGLLGGLAFLLPALHWVSPIGTDAWLGLVALESLFYGAWAVGATLTSRLPLWPLWGAALWVAMEWARGTFPIGGFPWARVAFSQGETPFTPYAALGGAPLVSFTVVLCGGLLALTALRGSRRAGPLPVVLPLVGALAVPAAALGVPRPQDEGRTVTVGVIQGNVPGRGMHPLGDEPAVVLGNHVRMLHEMAQAVRQGTVAKPDLVVLPENSTDIDPYRSDFARAQLDAAVKDIGVPVLVGAVVGIGENNRATRSLVWDPVTGPGAYYDKQKLVPFGEYTPFKDVVLALFERAALVGKQSVAGTRDGDLKLGPVTVGAINCYEVAFDDVVGGTARTGASPLVVQTNNATYALTNLPAQQLAMSQLRAVEHNRAVITSAITGISAYVTPQGKIAWRTGELVPASGVLTVPVRTAQTVATRVGALPQWLLILVGAGALVASRPQRKRIPAPNQGPADEQVGEA